MVDPEDLKNDFDEHIYEVSALVTQFEFRIAGLQGVHVQVKIWHTDVSYGGDRYRYTISHHVHTPTQAGPYTTSAPFGHSAQSTADKAIRDTLAFYLGAIKKGHTPSAKWFIRNEDF